MNSQMRGDEENFGRAKIILAEKIFFAVLSGGLGAWQNFEVSTPKMPFPAF